MVQIYKKILRAKGNGGEKESLTPNPSPNGEGRNYRDTPCGSQMFLLIITWLLKQTVSNSLLSFSERGLGGEVFIIFYDSTNAPHITCKASAHDVRSVSTINENGRKGDLLQTIRSRMTEKYFLISLTLSPAERGSAGNKLLINNRKTLPKK